MQENFSQERPTRDLPQRLYKLPWPGYTVSSIAAVLDLLVTVWSFIYMESIQMITKNPGVIRIDFWGHYSAVSLPCWYLANFYTQHSGELTLPLSVSVVWSWARDGAGGLLVISTQRDWACACVFLAVQRSQPVSAYWPTTTLLISLAHCHQALETIKVEENGTGRKWPEVWAPLPAFLLL